MYQLHPIEEIEGIGPHWGRFLREDGFAWTEDLLDGPEWRVAARIRKDRGFPFARLRSFRRQALLMQVEGLSGQHAEALFRAGRRDLATLASAASATVAAELKKAAQARVIPEAPDAKTVERWQKRALVVAHTRALAGRVVDGEGAPVAGAVVHCGQERARSAADGRFWLPALPHQACRVIIHAEGFRRLRAALPAEADAGPRHETFTLAAGVDEAVVVDEAAGGHVATFEADDEVVFVDAELAALPAGTPLVVRHHYRDRRVRLVSAYRRRVGRRVEVWRVICPAAVVPSGAEPRDVLFWDGRALWKTGVTPDEVRLAVASRPLPAGQERRVAVPALFSAPAAAPAFALAAMHGEQEMPDDGGGDGEDGGEGDDEGGGEEAAERWSRWVATSVRPFATGSMTGGTIIWKRFEGANGCDVCDCLTGCYEEVEHPHPSCDCEITDWEMEIFGTGVGGKGNHPTTRHQVTGARPVGPPRRSRINRNVVRTPFNGTNRPQTMDDVTLPVSAGGYLNRDLSGIPVAPGVTLPNFSAGIERDVELGPYELNPCEGLFVYGVEVYQPYEVDISSVTEYEGRHGTVVLGESTQTVDGAVPVDVELETESDWHDWDECEDDPEPEEEPEEDDFPEDGEE